MIDMGMRYEDCMFMCIAFSMVYCTTPRTTSELAFCLLFSFLFELLTIAFITHFLGDLENEFQ